MPQLQGSKSSSGGRLDGSNATNVAAANFAIGAGWGGTATFTVRADSTDQRGSITITASATTPAQATATVALTFIDGAYTATPPSFNVSLVANTQAVTETGATAMTCTTTALSWVHSALPVATKTYTYNWIVIA